MSKRLNMSNDEAVEWLLSLKNLDICGENRKTAIDKAVTALKSTDAESQWIPVSERLPKKCEYGEVLVTYIPSGGTLWTTVIIAHYSDLMGIAKPSFHIGEVGKESFQNITKQVTAWMPLPKPYEPQESEDAE